VAGSCRLLWEFLAELLDSPAAADVIRWEHKPDLKFRVVDPGRLAERWGREKGKAGMTYEKLSRALRYYYRTQIVAKVRGQRLTYRSVTSLAAQSSCYDELLVVTVIVATARTAAA